MRRHDLQLLAAARQGDPMARIAVARRYLTGAADFPKHPATALQYLDHPSVRRSAEADDVIADLMSLTQLAEHDGRDALVRSALRGNPLAQVKRAAWMLLDPCRCAQAGRWLRLALAGGRWPSLTVESLGLRDDDVPNPPIALLALRRECGLDIDACCLRQVRQAGERGDLAQLAHGVRLAVALSAGDRAERSKWIVAAMELSEQQGCAFDAVSDDVLQASLECMQGQADRFAGWALGRALCGIDAGGTPAARLAREPNLRKGQALLLRAADAGVDAAWALLHRLCSSPRSSVANPQMARFFLEKAAIHGGAESRRLLGALLLRESTTLESTEQAIHWLDAAASQGDHAAMALMRTLVLPVQGTQLQADAVLSEIEPREPWLAHRLRLARSFGLTRLEAMAVDSVSGQRPWGLVVARNTFISQVRLAAPRAVPALSPQARHVLSEAAHFFARAGTRPTAVEGDVHHRTRRLRLALNHLQADPALFFAHASTTMLERVRGGPKWAFESRAVFRQAMAATSG